MKSIIVGPSPNWYSTRVIDSNCEGVVAYGARGYVCLLDCKQYPPAFVDLFLAHQDRLTSLAFSKSEDCYNLLATSAEDGKTKIWDITTKECLLCMPDFENITCIDWQRESGEVLYIATEKKGLFVWETTLKSLTSIKTGEKNALLVIKSCSFNEKWIAAGCKGGLVAIIDCNKGHIIKKFRGHEADILSVDWSPICIEQQETCVGKYLASSSRDKTIRIWEISGEKVVHILTVPQTRKVSHYEETNKGRHWSAISWSVKSDNVLISTTFTGEMIYWSLDKEGKKKWENFKTEDFGGHNKCIFSIVPIRPHCETIISISLDRQIVLWDVTEKKSISVLTTLGGFAHALAFCSQGTAQLAVGSGDNMIRILNTTEPTVKCTGTFWNGIKAKVISIAWHPEKEGLLAFGTEEGRVGILNIMTSKSTVFQSFHKESVYRVAWGPAAETFETKEFSSKQKIALYSCGDFLIYIHNPSNPCSQAVNFDNLVAAANSHYKPLQRTELNWKGDMSVVAVGNSDGSIEIFSGQDLHLLAQVCSQRKLVNCLLWHPQFTAISESKEPLHAWLACASNNPIIHVYSLLDVLEKEQEEERKVTVISQPTRTLVGHQNRVVCLSWSLQVEGKLVSASYDGTAQVWDVLNGTPLANYRGHNGRLFSVVWSLSNPSVCYSGGEDYTVHAWNVLEQSYSSPPTKQFLKNSKKKAKQISKMPEKEDKMRLISEEDTKMLQEMVNEKKKQLLQSIEERSCEQEIISLEEATNTKIEIETGFQNASDDEVDQDVDLDEELDDDNTAVHSEQSFTIRKVKGKGVTKSGKGKKTQKSLFPYTLSLENRGKQFSYGDCTYLTDMLCSDADVKYSTVERSEVIEQKEEKKNDAHLGLFSTRTAAWNMVDVEATHHRKSMNLDYALQLEIWKGNIGGALREAANKRKLNDWLVSLAPLGSRDLWKEICEEYAKQLISEGAICKAVLYLLSIHKVYDAINLLREHKQYREALALAKLRLPSSDPLITTLLEEWAAKANRDGNIALAAKCYLALQEFAQASKQLLSNTDSGSMKTAAYISRKCGKITESQDYLASCVKIALKKNEWTLAKEAVSQHPEAKPILLVISTHDVLCKYAENYDSLSGNLDLISSILQNSSEPLETTVWEKVVLEKESFLNAVYSDWISENLLAENATPDSLLQSYSIIASLMTIQQHPTSVKEYYVTIAVEFTLALLTAWKTTENESMKGLASKHLNRIITLSNIMKNSSL